MARCEVCHQPGVITCSHGPALNFCPAHYADHAVKAHGFTEQEARDDIDDLLRARVEALEAGEVR